MKLTIIAEDNSVGIDGTFLYPLDLLQLDASIHAVQWYGEYGEVEYKTQLANGIPVKPANSFINDVAPYQFAIDAWTAAKEAIDAESVADNTRIPVSVA